MESTFIKRKNGFLDVLKRLGKVDAEKLKIEILVYFDTQLLEVPDDRKTIQFALQHSLNIYLDQLLINNIESSSWEEENVKSLFKIVLWMVKTDLIQNVYFFAFIDAVFDSRTILECERMFSFLEENAQQFAEIIHAIEDPNIRARVLKPLVGLMKRLSRATDTELCGRVLSFTAAVLPLSDPSGTNKKGAINTGNVTKLDESKVADIDSSIDDTPIDVQFWKTFWSIQPYIQNPWNVFEVPINWNKMVDTMKQILTTFTSTPLDIPEMVVATLRKSTVTPVKNNNGNNNNNNVMDIELPYLHKGAYFTKFLTSPRLIKLEIQDPYFRKHILAQFLIYLKSLKRAVDVKPTWTLTEAQVATVKELKNKVKETLENTPPQAVKFAQAISNILKREKNWVEWKKNQCKSFEKLPAKRTHDETKESAPISSLLTALKDSEDDEDRPSKRQRTDENDNGSDTKVNLGHEGLTRLWNGKGSEKDQATPELKPYLQQALEDEDLLFMDNFYEWKANRLLINQGLRYIDSRHRKRNLEDLVQRVFDLKRDDGDGESNKDSAVEDKESNVGDDQESIKQEERAADDEEMRDADADAAKKSVLTLDITEEN